MGTSTNDVGPPGRSQAAYHPFIVPSTRLDDPFPGSVTDEPELGFPMIMSKHAILAGFLALLGETCASAPIPAVWFDDPPPTDSSVPIRETGPDSEAPAPIEVRFRLVDGVRLTGTLTHWDDEGVDGSFGWRAWSSIDYRDVWRILSRVCDQERAADWARMGGVMLVVALDQPRAESWADRAFRRAERIDPEASALVADARDRARALRREREERRMAEDAERLRTLTPEANEWRADPWPHVTEEEQVEAVATMKADAARMLELAGLDLRPIETDYFLFYSDMPRTESSRWAKQLDTMYARLAEQFGLPEKDNIFWGKAVIFVFNDRDRFRLMEAQAFGQLAPEWASGMCHPQGPKVFVNFYRRPEDTIFAALLVHETVHGFMHRYLTPRRLPTWANEGFADYLASVLFERSPVDLQRREQGLRWIRGGGDVNAILDLEYADGTWPGEDGIGYNVGYLMVELMIRDRPRDFGAWVDAVKQGMPWEEALQTKFGVDRAALVDAFVRFYRVND